MPSSAWLDRLAGILSWGPVAELRAVLDRYSSTAGPLLAGGLAYSALFAIVPLLFVAAGLTGLLVGDPTERDRVVAAIADVLPPLRGLVGLVLTEAARSAGAISLVGFATLLWGGSRFLLAFDDAMARMTGGARTGHVVARNLVGLAAAAGVATVVVLGAAIAGLTAFLDAAAAHSGAAPVSAVVRILLEILPVAVAVLAMVLVYRFVPASRPGWSVAWRPAWVVALVLVVATRAFVFIAPRLIGAAAAIGTLATAFAALAWLGLSFQAILVGAAWVRVRAAGASTQAAAAGRPQGATPTS